MSQREPIEELDFERNGQWVRAERPGKDTVEGYLDIRSNFGDREARWLRPLGGDKIYVYHLRSQGYVFYRIDEPAQGAYERGVRDGLTKAKAELDRLMRDW